MSGNRSLWREKNKDILYICHQTVLYAAWSPWFSKNMYAVMSKSGLCIAFNHIQAGTGYTWPSLKQVLNPLTQQEKSTATIVQMKKP